MKAARIVSICLLLLFCSSVLLLAQQDVTIVSESAEVSADLDLKAVSELFKEAENLEEFEKTLNDPETGLNNLDLDENGEVDFIRVVEDVDGESHLIILQALLGESEFQDVATIEVEKTGAENYNMVIHGEESFYGADYYVTPAVVHIHTWPVIRWMYRPAYHPYRSLYHFGFYPRWWKSYRPVSVKVYHSRTVKIVKTPNFVLVKKPRTHSAIKAKYVPHRSVLVKKKTLVPVKVVKPKEKKAPESSRTKAQSRPNRK